MKTFGRDPKRKGYSLAELILGAAVIAAFMVRVYQNYAAAHEGDQFTQFVTEFSTITSEAQAIYTGTLTFENFTASAIAGNLPRTYVSSDENGDITVKTPYQTPIGFAGYQVADGNYGALAINLTLPVQDCTRFLTGIAPPFDYAGTVLSSLSPAPLETADIRTICGTKDSQPANLYVVQSNKQKIAGQK